MLWLIFLIPFFLGIAMGCVWAFAALWNFVHHGPPGVPLPNGPKNPGSLPLQATPTPPRDAPFSRAAAAGALLVIGSIPFGLIVYLIVKATIDASLDTHGQLQGPVAGNIVIFGFIPAFIGVALGWKAVGDFRYHRGHLRGGGTAVFAALGLPVLALILTALTNFEDIDRAINPIRIGWAGTLVACVVVLAAFAASIWAVRALWRFVHSGPPGVPMTPRPAPNWGLRIFLILAAFIGIPVLLVAIGLIIPQMQASRARNRAMPALEAEPEIRKAEDEAIERARQNLLDTKQRVAVGVATPDDEAEADMNVAIAKARGNRVQVLKATIPFLTLRFVNQCNRVEVGVLTPEDVKKTELQLLAAMRELHQAHPESPAPRPGLFDKYRTSISKLAQSDAKLSDAESKLADLRGTYLDRHRLVVAQNEVVVETRKERDTLREERANLGRELGLKGP